MHIYRIPIDSPGKLIAAVLNTPNPVPSQFNPLKKKTTKNKIQPPTGPLTNPEHLHIIPIKNNTNLIPQPIPQIPTLGVIRPPSSRRLGQIKDLDNRPARLLLDRCMIDIIRAPQRHNQQIRPVRRHRQRPRVVPGGVHPPHDYRLPRCRHGARVIAVRPGGGRGADVQRLAVRAEREAVVELVVGEDGFG